MAIEINNVTHTTTSPVDTGGQSRNVAHQSVEAGSGKAPGSSAATDQISLTATAQQLRGLEDQVAAQPVVDTQKVNAVRDALANGSFEIDPASVAGKFMSLERALGDLG